ncbi:MAG: BMC domain-containing protein [Polyangiales bacterium]
MGPALAVLETTSIARGYVALDAMAKRAPVTVLHAEPISPGKFWVAIAGGEAEVEEALAAGVERADAQRLDDVLLHYAHPAVLAAVAGGVRLAPPDGSVGVLELSSIAAAVRAADAAMKCADVSLVDLHLARGVGGKGYLVIAGELADVEASLDAGRDAAGEANVVGRELMPRPDEAVAQAAARPRSSLRGDGR